MVETSLGIAVGDLDGDSDVDVLVGNTDDAAQEVWFNDGSGSFVIDSQGSGHIAAVALGDLDGDGDLDAAVVDFNQPSEVWINQGLGTFTLNTIGTGTTKALGVSIGDLDGDGDLDVVLANWSNLAERLWTNDGSGSFVATTVAAGARHAAAVVLGNLSGVPEDLGDAPSPLPTLRSQDGARHEFVGTAARLGTTVDSETEGQPTADADGDDDRHHRRRGRHHFPRYDPIGSVGGGSHGGCTECSRASWMRGWISMGMEVSTRQTSRSLPLTVWPRRHSYPDLFCAGGRTEHRHNSPLPYQRAKGGLAPQRQRPPTAK